MSPAIQIDLDYASEYYQIMNLVRWQEVDSNYLYSGRQKMA